MTGIPICAVCLKGFQDFKSVMEDLVGWPVAFSWNEEGQAWITGPKGLDEWQKSILNRRFPVVAQIVSGLNTIRKQPQSAFKGTVGFYVQDDGIWRRKQPPVQLARFEFSSGDDCDHE